MGEEVQVSAGQLTEPAVQHESRPAVDPQPLEELADHDKPTDDQKPPAEATAAVAEEHQAAEEPQPAAEEGTKAISAHVEVGGIAQPLSTTEVESAEPEPKPAEPELKPAEPDAAAAEPEPKPVQPEPEPTPELKPAEPEATPAEPEPKPAEAEPQPAASDATAAEPELTPAEPQVPAAEPEPTPAQPEPTPAEPAPAPAEPEVKPSEPEPMQVEPEVNPSADASAAHPAVPLAQPTDTDEDHQDMAPPARQLEAGDFLPVLPPLEADESTDAAKKLISVSELVQRSAVIIFLYPRANTPGCTSHAIGFRDNYANLKAAGFEVVGISADKPKSQATWRTKNSFPFNLLSDAKMEAIRALGASKGEKGTSRSHLVVEKGGRILQAMYNVKPKDSVSAAVQLVTGRPAIQPAKPSRRPTVIEEEVDDDEPPRSKLDEPPLSAKRRPKPTSRLLEAEQVASVLEDLVGDDDDEAEEEVPRKRSRSSYR